MAVLNGVGADTRLASSKKGKQSRSVKTYRIAAIPADGIGPEVIAAGIQVLDALAKRDGGFRLDVTDFDWGSDRYKKTSALMPADGKEQLREFRNQDTFRPGRTEILTPTSHSVRCDA